MIYLRPITEKLEGCRLSDCDRSSAYRCVSIDGSQGHITGACAGSACNVEFFRKARTTSKLTWHNGNKEILLYIPQKVVTSPKSRQLHRRSYSPPALLARVPTPLELRIPALAPRPRSPTAGQGIGTTPRRVEKDPHDLLGTLLNLPWLWAPQRRRLLHESGRKLNLIDFSDGAGKSLVPDHCHDQGLTLMRLPDSLTLSSLSLEGMRSSQSQTREKRRRRSNQHNMNSIPTSNLPSYLDWPWRNSR
jgi:hypothetical protein